MEEGMVEGASSYKRPPPSHFDNSYVLEVKPLRSLVPIFRFPPHSAPQSPPFLCVPPSVPFPPEFTHFYPRSTAGPPDPTPHTPPAVPHPCTSLIPFSDEKKNRKNKNPKSPHPGTSIDSVLDAAISAMDLSLLDETLRSNGDKATVDLILCIYTTLRRRTYQLEEARDLALAGVRRLDLKPGVYMNMKSLRTNTSKRIGPVPGIEVGDVFFTRMEMCLIGLHFPSMAGIDYMTAKIDGGDLVPLAVSIVSSGEYDDDSGDGSVLMYTGHGGNVCSKEKEAVDQKLERGNLALEKSLHEANEVRVVRGLKDPSNPPAKIYVYDGLYHIRGSAVEKGKSGCNVFKYRLERSPAQPEAFTMWKNIEIWKQTLGSRPGVILPDLTSGLEKFPVCLVNDVDDEKGPAYFTYSPIMRVNGSPGAGTGCECRGGCLPYNAGCYCVGMNGGCLPYITGGMSAAVLGGRTVIYECGGSCTCVAGCRNRVSQGGTRVRLEVFKTEERGWALRSWDPIRAGGFVCEYVGEVIERSGLGDELDLDYVFDAGPEFASVLSSERVGNVARFMNHSCSPNVVWQPVSRAGGGDGDLYFAFFAAKNVPPMAELTYDYGMAMPDCEKKKKCVCGAENCRGYF